MSDDAYAELRGRSISIGYRCWEIEDGKLAAPVRHGHTDLWSAPIAHARCPFRRTGCSAFHRCTCGIYAIDGESIGYNSGFYFDLEEGRLALAECGRLIGAVLLAACQRHPLLADEHAPAEHAVLPV